MPQTGLDRHTPLFALDAVVMDTETTGLDPRKARIIEIGAVRLEGGRVHRDPVFETRINPKEKVPASATAIHGIDDAALASAPEFRIAQAAFQSYVGGRVLIGHTIGFDLAILDREYKLAGVKWQRPTTLDTRILAQIASPDLAGFSLEALAQWLGVAVTGRHSALGDARMTAGIFLGLVPMLREKGIRTLGEAMEACRAQAQTLENYARAGYVEPGPATDRREREADLARIDAYPYRHRVRDIMTSPPVRVLPGSTLREALTVLKDRRVSSVLVGHADDPASDHAILTERDVLRAVASGGAEALERDVKAYASRPLVTVPADAFVYRAIGRMNSRSIRHLAVVDEAGALLGAVSARDLLRLRASEAVSLGDNIDEAPDVAALAKAWARLFVAAPSLRAEGVGARDVAGVIARELGALTRRAAILAEERMIASGKGPAPCRYAVLVLGSGGRGESLLAMDQDNAVIFEMGEPDGPEDVWFAAHGEIMTGILHDVGVPYCRGGVMASRPAFRGSLSTWRARIDGWVRRARPEDLLNVDIFYDFRPVHGAGELAGDIWDYAWSAPQQAFGMLKLLAEAHARGEGAFGLFGRLKTLEGRVDLKVHGLLALVSGARILALRHGIKARSTPDRIGGLLAAQVGGRADLSALLEANERLLGLILDAQIADIAAGRPASNKVPEALIVARVGTSTLKADLARISVLDDLVRDQLART